MTFLIADTFTDSLARLTGDEQKAVKTTAFDLQLDPSAPEHFGKSPKIVTNDNAMPKVKALPDELDALVELIYAETGAKDADAVKVARGQEVFDSDDDDGDGEDDEGSCTSCHERTGVEGSSGPNLAGRVLAVRRAKRGSGRHVPTRRMNGRTPTCAGTPAACRPASRR